MKSVVDTNVPEVESQETYDFDRPLDDDSAIPVPIPMPTQSAFDRSIKAGQ